MISLTIVPSPRIYALYSSPNFKFIKTDIDSADLINHLLVVEEIDTIMHFVAQNHVDNSFGNLFEFTNNNITVVMFFLKLVKSRNGLKIHLC